MRSEAFTTPASPCSAPAMPPETGDFLPDLRPQTPIGRPSGRAKRACRKPPLEVWKKSPGLYTDPPHSRRAVCRGIDARSALHRQARKSAAWTKAQPVPHVDASSTTSVTMSSDSRTKSSTFGGWTRLPAAEASKEVRRRRPTEIRGSQAFTRASHRSRRTHSHQ